MMVFGDITLPYIGPLEVHIQEGTQIIYINLDDITLSYIRHLKYIWITCRLMYAVIVQ